MEIKLDALDFEQITIKDQNGLVQTFTISDELVIQEHSIQKDFMTQASKYAWWASLLEKVRAYYEASERRLEEVGSELSFKYRSQLDSMGKKYTKDVIEASVRIDPLYVQQSQEVEAWSYRTKQLQYVVKAFEQRKDMIIQMGADVRKTNASGGITSPFSH